MKKTLCIIMSVLFLTFAFVSCNSGSGGGDNTNKLTGEIKPDGLKAFYIGQHADENGNGAGLILSNGSSYEEFANMLAEGKRMSSFGCTVRALKEFKDKHLTKISFDVEADRDVTVTFQTSTSISGECKTVTLHPGEKRKIEFELDAPIVPDGLSWRVYHEMSSDGTTDMKAEGYAEWSQTVYKVTNLQIYCE